MNFSNHIKCLAIPQRIKVGLNLTNYDFEARDNDFSKNFLAYYGYELKYLGNFEAFIIVAKYEFDHADVINIVVPSRFVGYAIGKNGSNAKALSKEWGKEVNFIDSKLYMEVNMETPYTIDDFGFIEVAEKNKSLIPFWLKYDLYQLNHLICWFKIEFSREAEKIGLSEHLIDMKAILYEILSTPQFNDESIENFLDFLEKNYKFSKNDVLISYFEKGFHIKD